MLKNVTHIVLFVIAVVVFWAGLGAGLQYDPNLGTALWIVAGAIFVLNLLWIVLTRKRT